MSATLPAAAVREIRRLQSLHWDAAREIASPRVDVVLSRPGVGTLPPVAVVVNWGSGGRAGRHLVGAGQDDTPDVDLTLRRLVAEGFDVQAGDGFVLDGQPASVSRVRRDKGTIRAECRLIEGAVWP